MNRMLFAIGVMLMISPVYAVSDEPLFNVYSLQVQTEADVDNDEMLVILAAEHQNPNPATLAQLVNKDMQWALAEIKRVPALKARTLSYSSYPVYRDKDQKISSWQAQQQIEIKSTDIDALSGLLGTLQKRLQIKQMQFQPTTATRKTAQDKLIVEALDEFKARAELVRKNMKAKDYKVVSVDINTGSQFHPVPMMHREAKFSMAMDSAEVAVESGTSKVTVTLSGSVQLQ